jgi:hypothetical protein
MLTRFAGRGVERNTLRQVAKSCRPLVEQLEDRCVLSNLVVNGSFETPQVPSNANGITLRAPANIGGWTLDQNDVDLAKGRPDAGPTVSGYQLPPDGTQFLFLSGFTAGSIYQDLATVAGTAYRLRFAMSGDPGKPGWPLIKHMEVDWGSGVVATPTFDITSTDFDKMGWVYHEYTVVATTTTTRLRFSSLDFDPTGPAVDDVSVVPQLTDIAATKLDWNTAQSGVDFGYEVSGAALTQDTTAQLYWASGTTTDTILEPAATPIPIPKTTPVDQEQTVHLAPSDFPGGPAPGAKYLLAVVDPDNKIDEGAAGEANNVKWLPVPGITVTAGPITPVEGNEFTGLVATFTEGSGVAVGVASVTSVLAAAPSVDGAGDNYTATIAWGDGTSSTGTVSANSSGGFDVTGIDPTTTKGHVYSEETAPDQPYTFTVTVQALIYGIAFTNQATGVASVVDAPLIVVGHERFISPTPNVEFQCDELASFTDGNPAAGVEDFTARITWGDGQTSDGVVSAGEDAKGKPLFIVAGRHTYTQANLNTTMSITILDHGGAQADVPAFPVRVGASQPSPSSLPSPKEINKLLEDEAKRHPILIEAAKKYNVKADDVLKAIAWQESGWNPLALSPDCQHGKGIMQIDDRSWGDVGDPYYAWFQTAQVWDAASNIHVGANILDHWIQVHGGDLWLGVKNYNGAGDAADAYLSNIRTFVVTDPWDALLHPKKK